MLKVWTRYSNLRREPFQALQILCALPGTVPLSSACLPRAVTHTLYSPSIGAECEARGVAHCKQTPAHPTTGTSGDSFCTRGAKEAWKKVPEAPRPPLPGPQTPQTPAGRAPPPPPPLTCAEGSSESAWDRRLSPPRAAAPEGEASAPASLGSPIISDPGEATRRASPGVGDRNAGPESQENLRASDSDAQRLALPAAARKGSR